MEKIILNLIRQVSTNIPKDVLDALIIAKNKQHINSRGHISMNVILENIKLAKKQSSPICQDTWFPHFLVKCSKSYDKDWLIEIIQSALKKATFEWTLRSNAVDSITWENSWNNIWVNFPKISFEAGDEDLLEINLLLKWWWSENVSNQISLPADLQSYWKSWRDLNWIKNAIMQVVVDAQWKWCAPWILWVHIGWDRETWYHLAKRNLFKKIWEKNDNSILSKLEKEIVYKANELDIWPMWLWWNVTLLNCAISSSHRLPASFFVTVSYMCWASRRWRVLIDLKKWSEIENDYNTFDLQEDTSTKWFIKKIKFPITNDEQIRELKAWDVVSISWNIFTWRDSIHKYADSNDLDTDIKGSAIYHCWPVAIKWEKWEWVFTACWPTTSIREEPYQADFIKKTWIKAVIGKWWMWKKTLKWLKQSWAAYLHAIGWAASYYAKKVKSVKNVYHLDFWIPEALWEIELEDFLVICSMDSHWNSLHN